MSIVFAGTDTTATLDYRIYLEPSPTHRDEWLPPFQAITQPKASIAVVSLPETAGFVPGFPGGSGPPWTGPDFTSGPYRSMNRSNPGDFQSSAASTQTDMKLAYPNVPYAFLENNWGAVVPSDTKLWSKFTTPTVVTVTKPVGDTMVHGNPLGTLGNPGIQDYVCEFIIDYPTPPHSGLHELGLSVSLGFGSHLVVVPGWFDGSGAYNQVAYEFIPPPPYDAIFPVRISTVCYLDGILYVSDLNALTAGPFYTMAITLTAEQAAGFRPGGYTGATLQFPTVGDTSDGDFTFVIGGSGSSADFSALRLGQRNDGLGPGGHPRLSAANGPTSTQLRAAPRVGGNNSYS